MAEPVVYINGKRHVLPLGRGEVTLLQYLRELGLTGTKLGCGEGGCGACTVMVSSFDEVEQKPMHRAVNACLAPLYSVEGTAVVTVEGLGSKKKGLHPVQARLAAAHGSQCGFCTPGFVMSMYALLRSSEGQPTEEEIEDCLAGNLCRCTGYRPILEGFRSFAKTDDAAYTADARAAAAPPGASGAAGGCGHDHAAGGQHASAPAGAPICPSTGMPCTNGCAGPYEETPDKLTGVSEPIFPFELRRRAAPELNIPGPVAAWHRPLTLQRLLELKAEHQGAKLVCGNTEVGIEMKFKGMRYPVLIGATHVKELNAITAGPGGGVTFGASVTLTRLSDALKREIASRPPSETRGFAAIVEQLRWFAGRQIRNVSSIGGNVCTGSPISDLNPLWVALGATFVAAAAGRPEMRRRVPAREFFLGYRKVNLEPQEILLEVELPCTAPLEYAACFKQAHRRDDDIALANAGMRLRAAAPPPGALQTLCYALSITSHKGTPPTVADVSLAFGGMAACTVAAPKAEAALRGKPLTRATLEGALAALAEDLPLGPSPPGGMSEFRSSLASSFLFKFFLRAALALEKDLPGFSAQVAPTELSAAAAYHRPPSRGLQYYTKADGDEAVGAPLMHCSAELQVTGEAVYTDDMPRPAGSLHAALIMSDRPHAKLLSIDTAAALAAPGVVGAYTAAHIPGHNLIGPVLHDENLFVPVGGEVLHVGQFLGIVVAETEAEARAAARLVACTYEDLPAIMTIRDAIAAGSFYDNFLTGRKLEAGDADAVFADPQAHGARVFEGETVCGGQEHFYLEPQCSFVVPTENDEIHCTSSTQNLREHQTLIAEVLGIPMNKVVCKAKRLGGGFGGKESRSAVIACAAAVAAHHSGRPVRIVLDRDEDMSTTGHRHPFLGKYKVAAKADGTVVALDMQLYANTGHSMDLTFSIVERAMFHSDNVYRIPNMRVRGFLCRTNTPSNTAFRGFGGPQGAVFCEMWMDRVAKELGLPPDEVRRRNFYQEGDTTHFGQPLLLCRVKACWDEVVESSGYAARRAAAAQFNAQNRYKKRGVAVTPVKFGISFTSTFLNQGGALVHIYTDGSVLVTIGGVEMGQGLFTKCTQVAASVLGVPMGKVFISETSTDKVPNASPTAASASADIYGEATYQACLQLKERLDKVRETMPPDTKWEDLVNTAWRSRVDLCAHGFMATPNLHWDWSNPKGCPFNYFCYGASVSEVELDTLSGDLTVLRTDICMDVGNSLNPAIDVGQVEGGFVQGMGWLMLEELKWRAEMLKMGESGVGGDSEHPWVRPGRLFTSGPGTYKIPSANDVPIDFRVSLLKGAANPRAVFSSKAVGEPPFLLAMSVFFAAKEAVEAARADAGITSWFHLDPPATPERLRISCPDAITAQFIKADTRAKLSV